MPLAAYKKKEEKDFHHPTKIEELLNSTISTHLGNRSLFYLVRKYVNFGLSMIKTTNPDWLNV